LENGLIIAILALLVILFFIVATVFWQRLTRAQAKGLKVLYENEQLRVENLVLKREIAAKDEMARQGDVLLDKTKSWLSEKFEGLSNEVLLRSQRSFFDIAKETFSQYQTLIESSVSKKQTEVGNIISPLKTSLELMDKKIQDLELARKGAYDVLMSQVQQMSLTQVLLHKETSSLGRALRDPTARGRWGEIQLRRVVEVAGMLPHCDFEEQVHVEAQDGIFRPDMVIHMPNDRHVVIDAKVSLSSYLEGVLSEEPSVKLEKMQQHAKQVRQHVVKLSQKRYWDQFKKMPDFVILFLHGDCFLAPALEYDSELLEFASAQKILLATPTSLIAMLKVISYSWGEAKIGQHAQAILDEARCFVDRTKTFMDHFCDIGKNLERSVKSYDRAVGSFENRLLVSARRLAASGLDPESFPILPRLEIAPSLMQHERIEESKENM
jgi:DNA recombination protein RmuC